MSLMDAIAKRFPEKVYGEYHESTGSESPYYYSERYGAVSVEDVKNLTDQSRKELEEKQKIKLQKQKEQKEKIKQEQIKQNEAIAAKGKAYEEKVIEEYKSEMKQRILKEEIIKKERETNPVYIVMDELRKLNNLSNYTDKEMLQYIEQSMIDYKSIDVLLKTDDRIQENIKTIMPHYSKKAHQFWLKHINDKEFTDKLETELNNVLTIDEKIKKNDIFENIKNIDTIDLEER